MYNASSYICIYARIYDLIFKFPSYICLCCAHDDEDDDDVEFSLSILYIYILYSSFVVVDLSFVVMMMMAFLSVYTIYCYI